MSNTPQASLAALHEAIRTQLVAASATGQPLAGVREVGAYPRPGEVIKTPAIYFELDAIDVPNPGEIGTEQVASALTFNAYCVVSYKGTGKLAVRTLAASLMGWLKNKRFGQPVGPAMPMSADPDRMDGAGDEYEVFRVSWRHEPVYLGTSVWDATGVLPTEVYLGIDPDTGPANVAKYVKIAPPAQ